MRIRVSTGFILGLVIATTLFGTLVVFGQTDELPGRLHPVIVDIEQEVPVVADVPIETEDGIVTATVPMTLNLALRISLSSALTPIVTLKETTPEVSVVSGEEYIDDLGIPYTVEINSPDLSLTEWTSYEDPYGRFNVAGEVTLAPDAAPFEGARGQIRFYSADGTVNGIEEINGMDFRLGPAGAFEPKPTLLKPSMQPKA